MSNYNGSPLLIILIYRLWDKFKGKHNVNIYYSVDDYNSLINKLKQIDPQHTKAITPEDEKKFKHYIKPF